MRAKNPSTAIHAIASSCIEKGRPRLGGRPPLFQASRLSLRVWRWPASQGAQEPRDALTEGQAPVHLNVLGLAVVEVEDHGAGEAVGTGGGAQIRHLAIVEDVGHWVSNYTRY